MKQKEALKVLIADDDGQLALRLASDLSDRGFSTQVASTGKLAKQKLIEWKPKFLLVDLMLPEANGIELIQFLKTDPALKHHPIQTIVISGHNSLSNVRSAIQAGARDYMVKPFKSEEVYQRLVYHLRGQKNLDEVSQRELVALEDDALVLHLTDLVLKQALAKAPLKEVLYNLTEMAAIRMDGVRCSIVHVVDPTKGIVVASNDNKEATGIQVDLNKYPEITQVMNFGQIVALENLKTDPQFKNVLSELQDLRFNSLIVCPIERQGKPFGVLSVRLPEEKTSLADNEIRFAEIVSHATSLLLGQGRHLVQGDFWLDSKPSKGQVLSFASASKKR